MDVVGAIDAGTARGHVAGQFELDEAAFFGHVLQGEVLLGEDIDRLLVDADAGEDLFVADAAAGVGVGGIDELGDGASAISEDVGRDTFGNGNDFVVDDEDAVVLARDEGLDDDAAVAAFLLGDGKRLEDGLVIREVDHHAAAVVAIEGLGDDGIAEAAGLPDGVLGAADNDRPRHGDANFLQHAVGEFFVAGHLDGDVGGLAGDGGPDALLVGTVSELDERAAGIETEDGDLAALGLGDDGSGAGAVGHALGDADHVLLELALEVEVGDVAIDEVVEQALGKTTGGEADVLLPVLVDDVVAAALAAAAGLAAGDLGAGKFLEFEGDVLEDVAHPGALAHALEEAARFAEGAGVVVEAGDEFGEAFVEAGNLVGGAVLEFADVDVEQDGGHAGPEIGSAVDGGGEDLDRHAVLRCP